jgi:O-succinylbenzoate synthase
MLRLDVRAYCRPFRQPLSTAHGLWAQREGLILRFEDDQGTVSFGEVAPIPWFGTETLEQAKDFCDRWPRHFAPAQTAQIPETLPACQFGFSTTRCRGSLKKFPQAEQVPHQNPGIFTPKDICALLPAGTAALSGWQSLWQQGHRTFKWKIGVTDLESELAIFQQLTQTLPAASQLRLDANGGLTPDSAESWLQACDRAPIPIEFIEQPLAPNLILDWLPQVQGRFATAIALDESVATLQQLQRVHQQVGDQVVYVVKPAIAGFSQSLLDFCRQNRLDVVFSSALETPVGRNRVYELAQNLWAAGLPQRSLGFGVGHWFADDWETLSEEALWARL